MKRVIYVLCLVIFLCGCAGTDGAIDEALRLRSAIEQAEEITFSVDITADYGDMTYGFSMDCTADSDGYVTFCVTAPETISGITGKLTADGGSLTFDDTVLSVPMLTDDQIPPLSAPWILLRTLRAGCITSCADGRLTIDDSYADDALTLDIRLGQDGMPTGADIYWKNRRILVLTVTSFHLT